jgi:hypothetical protein
MRHPLLLLMLLLTAWLPAQSGRQFRRDTRTPPTAVAAATTAVEASSRAVRPPIAKLRSGRPWPRHHFARTPSTPVAGGNRSGAPVDASHGVPASTGRRGFWGPLPSTPTPR